MSRGAERLQAIRELQPHWRYGEGVPFTDAAIEGAERLLHEAEAQGQTADVFPLVSGAILCTVYVDGVCVERVVDADGTLSVQP